MRDFNNSLSKIQLQCNPQKVVAKQWIHQSHLLLYQRQLKPFPVEHQKVIATPQHSRLHNILIQLPVKQVE